MGKKVICGRRINIQAFKRDPSVKDEVRTNVSGVGGYGGVCTCPNGESYMVGDKMDHCLSLACIDGKSGPCEAWNEPFRKGVEVKCGKPIKKHIDDLAPGKSMEFDQ